MLGRPRDPDVLHEAPAPGEPTFACRGSCELFWPCRLRSAHSSYCTNCWRAYNRERTAHARTTREKALRDLRAKHNKASPRWLKDQLAAQDMKCPICTCALALPSGKPDDAGDAVAVADYDDRTGLACGVLCNRCDAAFGAAFSSLDDDPKRLHRAISYFRKYTASVTNAHLTRFSGASEPMKRGPRVQEEKHDPNESIDSIVSRMGTEIIGVPMLPAPRKR